MLESLFNKVVGRKDRDPKHSAKAICSDFRILTVKTRFRPLLYGQFNDMEINRWLYSSSSPLKNSPSLQLVLKKGRPKKFPFYGNK